MAIIPFVMNNIIVIPMAIQKRIKPSNFFTISHPIRVDIVLYML